MSIHWDCDEERKGRTGDHVPPYLATVTYLTSAGAPTIVLPVASCPRGRAVMMPEAAAEPCLLCYASFPITGKHLAFDGRLLHGACRDDDPAPHEASDGERVTVLVNLWLGYRPVGVEELSDELVAALAAGRGEHGDVDWESFGADATMMLAERRAVAALTTTEAAVEDREWPIGSYHHPPVRVSNLVPLTRSEEAAHFWSCSVEVAVVDDA